MSAAAAVEAAGVLVVRRAGVVCRRVLVMRRAVCFAMLGCVVPVVCQECPMVHP